MRFVGTPEDITLLRELATSSTLTNSYGRPVVLEARETIEDINGRFEK
jgi:hypothetical protein